MKHLSTYTLLVLCLVLFSSCTSSVKNTKYYPVVQKEPRQSSLGFSITPPPGKNWFERLKNDSLLYLKLTGDTHSYTILTEAREVQLEQSFLTPATFLDFVKAEKRGKLNHEGYTHGNSTFTLEPGLSQFCVRYRQTYEDHNLAQQGDRHHVNVNQTGLFCRHPDYPEVAIDVSYQEKALSDVETDSYSQEGEKFLASLTFEKKTI